MSTDTAPPPVEDAKVTALRELARRHAANPEKMTAIGELARRRGVTLGNVPRETPPEPIDPVIADPANTLPPPYVRRARSEGASFPGDETFRTPEEARAESSRLHEEERARYPGKELKQDYGSRARRAIFGPIDEVIETPREQRSVDRTGAAVLHSAAMLVPGAAPLVAGLEAAPPVRDVVNYPFEKFDEHVAGPLSFGSETARTALNLGAMAGAAKGGARVAKQFQRPQLGTPVEVRPRVTGRGPVELAVREPAPVESGRFLAPRAEIAPAPARSATETVASPRDPGTTIHRPIESAKIVQARIPAPEGGIREPMPDRPPVVSMGQSDAFTAYPRKARPAEPFTRTEGTPRGVPLETRGQAPAPPAEPPATGAPEGGFGDRARPTMSPAYAADRNIDTLKRYGPEGEELSHRVRAYEHEVRGEAADFDWRFRQATKHLSREEKRVLHEGSVPILERRVPAPTPGIAKVVEWWNGPSGEASRLATYVNESGSFINDPRTGPRKIKVGTPDFAPQKPMGEWLDAVHRGDAEALAFVDKSMVGPGKEFATRAEAVEALRNYRDTQLKPFNPGTESPRLRKLPDEVREQDFFKLIPGYAHRAIRSAAEHRQMKFLDAKGRPRNIREGSGPQGDLGDLLEGIRRNRGSGDAAAAEAKYLDLVGRNPLDWSSVSKLQRDVGAGVGAANAVRYYTRLSSWLRNFTQAPTVLAHVGPEAFGKGAFDLATKYGKTRETALRTGAAAPHFRMAETMGLVESELSGATRSAGRKTANAAMLPFDVADRQVRLLATASAPHFAKTLSKQLNGSPRAQQIALEKAKAMDLTPDLVARLKAGTLTKADMATFTRELVDLTNIRIARTRRLPASAAAGLDRQIHWQGKNFNAEQSRVFKRVALDQLKAKNPVPMLLLIGGTAGVGYGFTKMLDALVGPSDFRPSTPAAVLRQGGAAGVVGDLALSLVPDEEGKTRFKAQLDRLSDDQFSAFTSELAGFLDKQIDRPTERKVRVGEAGVTLDVKKSRMDIVLDTLRRITPAGAEAERILDRFLGDNAISGEEQAISAKRKIGKARRVELEVR